MIEEGWMVTGWTQEHTGFTIVYAMIAVAVYLAIKYEWRK